MKQEDIIRMAREADWYADNQTDDPYDRRQIRDERFSELVRVAEREACERVAGIALLGAEIDLAKRVLRAIRARGQA